MIGLNRAIYLKQKRFMGLVAACIIFSSTVFCVRAETLTDIFNSANNAFWNGEYQKAVSQYSHLEELGVSSSSLSFNLGTAYARLGKLGLAVYHYERALKFEPGNADAIHNLSVIRDYLARRASQAGRDADLAPAVGPWRAILDRFSSKGAALGFLVFHLCLFAVLIGRRFVLKEMPRLFLGVLAGILSIFTVISFSIAVGKWYQDEHLKEAVVLTSGVLEVKEGPLSDVTRFTMEEGSRIKIVDENNGWIRFQDSQGQDGWVPQKELGII